MPQITALTVAQCGAAALLSQQAFAHAPGQQWTQSQLAAFVAQANCVALGAHWQGALSGFALVQLAGPEAELLSIATAADRRGQGIGAALLRGAVQHAVQGGAVEMVLEVAVDNMSALALYEKFGFVPVGKRTNYYKSVSDQWVDASVLRLLLA